MKITYSSKKSAKQVKDKNTATVFINEGNETEVVKVSSQKQLHIGIGKPKDFNLRKLHLLARRIIVLAKGNKVKKIAVTLGDFSFENIELSDFDLGKLLAMNFGIANYEYNDKKTPPKGGWPLISSISITGSHNDDFKRGVEEGLVLAESINASRTLANTPGGEMTPKLLAQSAKNLAKGTGIKVKVLGKKEMEKLGMGAVLGVGQGSNEEPQFIVMEYKGADSDERPIVLVGKGVTFDTGGVLVKPFEGITDMHMDMSGGATVIGAIVATARLGIKKNVIALIPAVENMVSGSAFRPHDILKSMSGKTIEVAHTDAEGRLILADGLYYAGKEYNPRLVIDVATLTGAALVALGQRASAIFTRNSELSDRVEELGEEVGDYVWPLPLWEEFEEEIKGKVGDFSNLGKYTRAGGTITAAAFLLQFTKEYPKDCPWLHIDMAPRMVSIEGDQLARGSSGSPVRLLVRLIEEY